MRTALAVRASRIAVRPNELVMMSPLERETPLAKSFGALERELTKPDEPGRLVPLRGYRAWCTDSGRPAGTGPPRPVHWSARRGRPGREPARSGRRCARRA